MRWIISIIVLLSVLAEGAAALDTSDPQDEVYRQLDLWAARGYVDRLPLLRPYPGQLIVSLLKEVADRGDAASAREAKELLTAIDGSARIRAEGYHATRATQDDLYSATGLYLTTAGRLNDLITVTGRLGAIVVVEPGAVDAFVPGERSPVDHFVDWSSVSAAGYTLLPTLSAAATTAIGTDRLWLQMGVNRNSFGPFDEGPVLSPQAPQAGHLSVTWRGEHLTYTEFLLTLAATTDQGDAIGDDGDIGVFPNKYLNGQSFQFSPVRWLDIGLFETVVFGERFEPLYLVPVIPRTYTSIYSGAADNLMLGFSVTARLPQNVGLDLMFYADDMHFLDMLSFNFDTKYKVSGQAGVTWTPLQSLLKRVSLDYALVTPYTYSHRRESIDGTEDILALHPERINFYNYSHMGRSLVALDPNSDRLRLRALLTPRDRLDVTLSAVYRRHANPTEGTPYGTNTWATGTSDGGINDNGYVEGGDHLFDTVDFLSQDVIEQILLLGADCSWRTPLSRGTLFLEGGYTVEIARNKRGSDPNNTAPVDGNDVVLHHLSLGLRYAW